MAGIVLTNIAEAIVNELHRRAAAHRRSAAEEAKSILSEALTATQQAGWEGADAIHARLSRANREFTDSADLIREDRDR